MTENQIRALKLLDTATHGRFDFWMLSGDSNGAKRAEIMTAFNGVKTPKGKAGVNAMRNAFYAVANPAGDCEAARQPAFAEWARKVLSGELVA